VIPSEKLDQAVENITEQIARLVARDTVTLKEHGEVEHLMGLVGLVERVKALQSGKPSTPEVRERPEVKLDGASGFRLEPAVREFPGEHVRVEAGRGDGAGCVCLLVTDDECGAVWLSLDEWNRLDAAARKILAGGAS